MSDSSTGEGDGARMMLEPNTVHDEGGEPAIDCPQCGSTVSLTQVIQEGRCTGQPGGEASESEDGEQLQEGGCTAELSLELVWEE